MAAAGNRSLEGVGAFDGQRGCSVGICWGDLKDKEPIPRLLSQYLLIKVGFSKNKDSYLGHEAEFAFQINE